MCLLYRNEYRNFKLTKSIMGNGLGKNGEDWKRQINWSCNIHMRGNSTRKLPVYLSVSQTSKKSCFSFYLLCFSSTKSENSRVEWVMTRVWESGGGGRGQVSGKG
jgi:hypothetical protein